MGEIHNTLRKEAIVETALMPPKNLSYNVRLVIATAFHYKASFDRSYCPSIGKGSILESPMMRTQD
jgi:hypothetical protein